MVSLPVRLLINVIFDLFWWYICRWFPLLIHNALTLPWPQCFNIWFPLKGIPPEVVLILSIEKKSGSIALRY